MSVANLLYHVRHLMIIAQKQKERKRNQMAEINIEKMAHDVAEAALDSIEYQGKTIREWMKIIVEQDQKFGNWIPVSEGLPEEGQSVIASTKYGVYPEARYTKEYGWEWAYEAGADYWRELEEVEAWMPLPKPYKSEGSETKQDLAYADQETMMPAT